VQVADHIDFGPELQIAKGLDDECLNEWSAEARPESRAIVTRAFNTDKAGQINRSENFMLLRLDISDARWLRTLAATDAADLAAMTAGVGVSGIAAVLDATEAPDGAALAASVGIGAGLDASDLGQDAATLAGAMAIAAVLDTMDSPDAATLAGSVGISGALDATEAGQDAVALAGLVFIAAALDAQETGWDVFAANDLSAPLPLPLPALWRDKPRVAAWPDAPRGALWHDQPRRATWRAA